MGDPVLHPTLLEPEEKLLPLASRFDQAFREIRVVVYHLPGILLLAKDVRRSEVDLNWLAVSGHVLTDFLGHCIAHAWSSDDLHVLCDYFAAKFERSY